VEKLSYPPNLQNLRIVLVRTRNPLNIGAAARAMSNFGAFHLGVVTPYEKAFREAVSAVGAAPLLAKAEEHDSVEEAVRDCSLVIGTTAIGHRELQHEVHSLEAAAKQLRKKLETGRVAILFGSEKTGLSNHDLSHCHWLLRIPTREDHRSMNLAQAVAIVVYEISRTAAKLTAKSRLPRAAADMETVIESTRHFSKLSTPAAIFTVAPPPRPKKNSVACFAASSSAPATPKSSSACFAKSSGG